MHNPLTAAALNKINTAQSELKITPTFKVDKKTFTTRVETVMKGSSVRSDSIQAICEKYVDFAAIYADLDGACALAKGRADALILSESIAGTPDFPGAQHL